MPNEVHTQSEPGLTSLLGGIISDFGDLIRQEIRFAKAEVKSDLSKTREAVSILAVGIGIASVSGMLLVWMLVYLLHWLTIPAGDVLDPAKLPLWACFGIVGGILAIIGGAAVGGLLIGWLGKLFVRLLTTKPMPPWATSVLRVGGGVVSGWLVYLMVFGGGGSSVGGPGGSGNAAG